MKTKPNQKQPAELRAGHRAVCLKGSSSPVPGESHPVSSSQGTAGAGCCWMPRTALGTFRGMGGSGSRGWHTWPFLSHAGTAQARHGHHGHCATCAGAALSGCVAPKVCRCRRGSAGRTRVPHGTVTPWWVLLAPRCPGAAPGRCGHPSCRGPSWKEPLLLLLLKN